MSTPSPSRHLGPYELVEPIGKGGMGEVWRAHDSRLGRDVAIKISAEQFTDRFDREARAIAALNHPNICTLHDVGPNYLVMELIDGPTLADRIQQGAIPLDEALNIARQIADALDAAHQKNIVHRDLKPGNITVPPDGSVKVLDFGLAKAGVNESAVTSDSPTLMHSPTLVGVILGTAAYMAPEQARGKLVDRRADIWAFGVVLYELLTGKRLFEGETISDVLAGVLKEEPDLTAVPAKFRRLIAKCLQKDPKKRLRDMGDWEELLDNEPSSAAPSQPRFGTGRWVAAGVLAFALAGLAFAHFREAPPLPRQPTAVSTIPGPPNTIPGFLALSPDGRMLAVNASGAFYLRALDSPQWRLLSNVVGPRAPFWSRDSKSIGFYDNSDRRLKIIAAGGGPAQTLCDAMPGVMDGGGGGSWSGDGIILVGNSVGEIMQVKASDGACAVVMKPEPGARYLYPVFLQDGRHFLYLMSSADESKRGIWLGSLDRQNGTPKGRLLADYSGVIYTPALAGSRYSHLLFIRETTLLAQPFDDQKLQLAGDPFPMGEQASQSLNAPMPNAAADGNGTLIYVANFSRGSQLAWLDRTGKEIARAGSPHEQHGVDLSPDETMAAMSRRNPNGSESLWLFNFSRDSESRFAESAATPVWSPGGKYIVYSQGKALYMMDASGGGSAVAVLENGNRKSPSDLSRDGGFLLYTEIDPKDSADIWYLPDPLKPGAGKPVKWLGTKALESQAQFSPDGHWVAYSSDESGTTEVYIRRFPSGPGQTKVSSHTGREPRWSPDGKEIYYVELPTATTQRLFAVSVRPGRDGTLDMGVPQPLFEFRAQATVPQNNMFLYSPAPDGRFLVNLSTDTGAPTINLITNWQNLAPGRK